MSDFADIDVAIRVTEMMMAVAFIQQSFEHLAGLKNERVLYLIRIALCLLLLAGAYPVIICFGLFVCGVLALYRFQGPYNGGSDRMGMLILFCLTAVHFMPNDQLKEYAFGYLAVQLVLSYFMSGWVKIVNPEWRNGLALQDVFRFSVYPVCGSVRSWCYRPRVLLIMSWAVIGFELLFPFSLLMRETLIVALLIAAIFHFANACLFGLNRFFWIWLAAYPSIIWLQDRVFS